MPTSLFQPALTYNFAVLLWDVQGPAAWGLAAGDRNAEIVGGLVANLSQLLYGGFAEVSGLNAELEVETYQEGGNNFAPHRFAKVGKYPNLVLKRGVTSRTDLWDWHLQVLEGSAPVTRKSGIIILFDRGGPGAGNPLLAGLPRIPIAAWYISKAIPERVQGPQLDAKSNNVAIESVELSHQGLNRVSLSMIPGAADLGAAVGAMVSVEVSGVAAGLGGIG
jgi:phage tail-like protein